MNFSGTMEPHISYEVSFSSSLPMEEDYDYDDRIIQDYVEELIRDDGSRKGIQSFEFVMGRGWYSGAIIDGTVTWWTGNYSAETFEAPSYGNYYGACLLPDGSCTETSLDMCRSLGGRFQGPGTSCYPDAGWARPRVMRADSGNQCGYDWKDGEGPCPDPAECTECGRCSECCQDHNGWECEYCDEEGWGDISMHTCPDSWKMQRKWYCSVCNADLKDRILYHNKAGDPDNMANYCQECDSPFCNEHWDGNLPVLCTVCSRVRNFSSESTSSGLGKGFVIGIVAGIVSGLVTTVFGTVISEILLDRLREDPELEITEEDPGTNAPPL